MERIKQASVDSDNRTYYGIDNGVTGGITILSSMTCLYHDKTPVKNCLNYTKVKAFINRVDTDKMANILVGYTNPFCFIERPMVHPGRFKATISAIRCLEATEIILEQLQIPYQFIDSKEWQKALLPSGLQKEELKRAAESVAKRLFPNLNIVNADSVLIAEYCRRMKK